MKNQPLEDYFSALERLKNGTPKIVTKGTKITNDSVSIEAGRGKGSIKKSRPIFSKLIAAIDDSARIQSSPARETHACIVQAKTDAEGYRAKLDAALAREVCLLRELVEVKKKLAQLTGANVLPIRGKSKDSCGLEPDH